MTTASQHLQSKQAAMYARTFQMHRAALLDLLEQIPAEHENFAAWEGGMSFIAQADHLAVSADRFLKMIRGEPATEAPAPSSNLTEARGRLWDSQERALSAISAMSDEDLARMVPAFGGREMPAAALLDLIISHEAHHKGQVWLMARMVGVKPPMFVKMG